MIDSSPDAMTAAPASEAFSTLRVIIERLTRRRVVAQSSLYTYEAPAGRIYIPNNDVEGLFHELCHWVSAGPQRRHLENYGLDRDGPGRRGAIQEEICCGWIEGDTYARAGVHRPKSSVDAKRYQDAPQWHPVALSRWRRYTSWLDRNAVVEALRLPGGDVGLWKKYA